MLRKKRKWIIFWLFFRGLEEGGREGRGGGKGKGKGKIKREKNKREKGKNEMSYEEIKLGGGHGSIKNGI